MTLSMFYISFFMENKASLKDKKCFPRVRFGSSNSWLVDILISKQLLDDVRFRKQLLVCSAEWDAYPATDGLHAAKWPSFASIRLCSPPKHDDASAAAEDVRHAAASYAAAAASRAGRSHVCRREAGDVRRFSLVPHAVASF